MEIKANLLILILFMTQLCLNSTYATMGNTRVIRFGSTLFATQKSKLNRITSNQRNSPVLNRQSQVATHQPKAPFLLNHSNHSSASSLFQSQSRFLSSSDTPPSETHLSHFHSKLAVMDREFDPERGPGSPIYYVRPSHLLEYQVHINEGKLYDLQGEPLTRSNAAYVMNSKGEIFIEPDSSLRISVFKHSSFLHGAPVAAAGLMNIQYGELRTLNNLSGHYKPTLEHLEQVVLELESQGIPRESYVVEKKTHQDNVDRATGTINGMWIFP